MRSMKLACSVLLVAGCGKVVTAQQDAPENPVDAAVPDGVPDAPPDAPPAPANLLDFENLAVGGQLAGTDGWKGTVLAGAPSAITAGTTSVNMTRIATCDANSAESLVRSSNATFAIPTFTGTETGAFIQADVRWNRPDDGNGIRFVIGVDLNGDNQMAFNEGRAIRVQDGRYGFDNSNIGPSAARAGFNGGVVSDWYQLRLVMDFTTDIGTLMFRNLTRGDVNFQSIVSGPLQLGQLATGARVTDWNAISLLCNRSTEWDNIIVRPQ